MDTKTLLELLQISSLSRNKLSKIGRTNVGQYKYCNIMRKLVLEKLDCRKTGEEILLLHRKYDEYYGVRLDYYVVEFEHITSYIDQIFDILKITDVKREEINEDALVYYIVSIFYFFSVAEYSLTFSTAGITKGIKTIDNSTIKEYIVNPDFEGCFVNDTGGNSDIYINLLWYYILQSNKVSFSTIVKCYNKLTSDEEKIVFTTMLSQMNKRRILDSKIIEENDLSVLALLFSTITLQDIFIHRMFDHFCLLYGRDITSDISDYMRYWLNLLQTSPSFLSWGDTPQTDPEKYILYLTKIFHRNN